MARSIIISKRTSLNKIKRATANRKFCFEKWRTNEHACPEQKLVESGVKLERLPLFKISISRHLWVTWLVPVIQKLLSDEKAHCRDSENWEVAWTRRRLFIAQLSPHNRQVLTFSTKLHVFRTISNFLFEWRRVWIGLASHQLIGSSADVVAPIQTIQSLGVDLWIFLKNFKTFG